MCMADARRLGKSPGSAFLFLAADPAARRKPARAVLDASGFAVYCRFQPLTSTVGFAAPNSLARYVAVTSRFSPGSREM